MNSSLESLQPASFWTFFKQISEIPRCSGKEQAILDYLKRQADLLHLSWQQDSVGNLRLRKPASPGFEKHPGVILQGHVDMVCEQNEGRGHDFSCDPLQLVVENGWVHAQQTTLGADNGVAVAAMLAVLADSQLVHGPLDCLFTVDEETGLTGALGLDPSLVNGKVLLNLDSDAPGEFIVGCAGGSTLYAETVPETETGKGSWYRVDFRGWHGGHSGVMIHENRGNPLKTVGRFFNILDGIWQIASLDGGDKHNAIPREATLVLGTTQFSSREGLKLLVHKAQELTALLQKELGEGPRLEVSEVACPDKVLTAQATLTLVRLLNGLPHGVNGGILPNGVETSNNLASVRVGASQIRLVTSQRSSRVQRRDELTQQIKAVMELAGLAVKVAEGYPAWSPADKSPLKELCVQLWPQVSSIPARVTVIHAGLECGIIGDKLPGLDMISFGPAIEEAHTPQERLNCASVEEFWNFLVKLLGAL